MSFYIGPYKISKYLSSRFILGVTNPDELISKFFLNAYAEPCIFYSHGGSISNGYTFVYPILVKSEASLD